MTSYRKKKQRTEGVVDTEVETTVHNDTNHRRNEATVETGNTIGGKSLLVDIDETVKLAGSSTLRGLRIVGKTGTGIVKRVHEKQRGGTGSTTRGEVTREPLPVTLRAREREQGLEVVLCTALSVNAEFTIHDTY